MHWSADPNVLVEPLRQVADHGEDENLRRVLNECSAQIVEREYDNWNGGTTYYALVLHLPPPLFAHIESDAERIEGALLERVKRQQRQETRDFVTEVLLQPSERAEVMDVAAHKCRYWKPNHFRLFLSHLNGDKLAAVNLKRLLEPYGITSFVAHEDIEPTKEWQDEIENALHSMDALAAIIAPTFGASKWTDHEVGVALGRGKVVLPIAYGANPYGLIAKFQALPGKGKTVSQVAKAVFQALATNLRTASRLEQCLVEQMAGIDAPDEFMRLWERLREVPNPSNESLLRVRDLVAHTDTLLNDDAVIASVNDTLNQHDLATVQTRTAVADDDIPF